jgi:hypothetical protein
MYGISLSYENILSRLLVLSFLLYSHSTKRKKMSQPFFREGINNYLRHCMIACGGNPWIINGEKNSGITIFLPFPILSIETQRYSIVKVWLKKQSICTKDWFRYLPRYNRRYFFTIGLLYTSSHKFYSLHIRKNIMDIVCSRSFT